MLTVPVPMKAHLNPAVLIGIDLFARRADHHRGLNSPDTRAARAYGRAVWQVGRHGLKLVAVGAALLVRCLFFQNLGLLALMMHAEQEPIAVQGRIGVERQAKTSTSDKLADNTFAMGLLLVDLVGFQSILGATQALIQIVIVAGPGVVLQAWRRCVAGLAEQAMLGAAKVVVVTGDGIHANLAAWGELEDDGLADHLNVVAQLEGGAFQGPEGPAVVTNHQDMPVFPVLKVIMNTFVAQQSLKEIQLRFIVLDTIRPGLIGASQLKTIAGRIESGFGQQLLQDLGSGQVLENAQIMAQPQPIEARGEMNSIISPTAAGLELNGSPDGAMYQARFLQWA